MPSGAEAVAERPPSDNGDAGADASGAAGTKDELSPPPSPMDIRKIKEGQFDAPEVTPQRPPRPPEDRIGKHGLKGMTATVAPTDMELPSQRTSLDPMEAWRDGDNVSIASSVASGHRRKKKTVPKRAVAPPLETSVSSLDDLSRPASGRPRTARGTRQGSARSRTSDASSEPTKDAAGVVARPETSPAETERRIVSELATTRDTRAFVPLEAVTRKVAAIVADMTTMRQRHLEIVRSMEKGFGEIEERTRAHYVAFVAALNESHAAKAAALRTSLRQLAAEVRRQRGDAEAATASVRERADELARENRDLLARMEREREELTRASEQRVADMSAQFEKERARLAAEASGDRSKAEAATGAEVDGLKEALAEARAEIVRVSAALAAMSEGKADAATLAAVAAAGAAAAGAAGAGAGRRASVEPGVAIAPVVETKIVEVFVPVPMPSAPPPPLPLQGLSLEETARIEGEKKALALRADAAKEEANALRRAYEELEAQFKSVVAVVDAGGAAALGPFIERRVGDVESQVTAARAAEGERAEEIAGWERAFQEEEGRPPTEDDRRLVRGVFAAHEAAVKEVARLEAEVRMLKDLAAGRGPAVAPAPEAPSDAGDATRALERVNEELGARLAKLADENEKLRDIASSQPQGLEPDAVEAELRRSLESQAQAYRAEVERLRAALEQASLAALSGRGGAGGPSDPELRARASRAEALVAAKAGEVARLETRIREMEASLVAGAPADVADQLKRALQRATDAEKEASELREATAEKSAKISSLELELEDARESAAMGGGVGGADLSSADSMQLSMRVDSLEGQLKDALAERDALQARLDEIEAKGGMSEAVLRDIANDPSAKDMIQRLQEEAAKAKKQARDDAAKIKSLTRDVRAAEVKASQAAQQAGLAAAAGGAGGAAAGGGTSKDLMVKEKQLKDATRSLELHKARYEKTNKELEAANAQLAKVQKDLRALEETAKRDHDEVLRLTAVAGAAADAVAKADELKREIAALKKENQALAENYKSEQTLRKKYYNMIEDMKGKIRVYCRERPMSQNELKGGYKSVCAFPDEYTIVIDSQRGPKEFQFDQVFPHEASQEKVYEEVHNLIQSAVDGYNVCIFAYGQTGSGKTFTIVGPPHLPGIVPRAMDDIFATMEKNKNKFSFTVECYMLELYNDQLVDLLTPTPDRQAKMEIKKDAKGLVYVAGTVSRPARSKADLQAIFDEGTKKRHVSATNMNSESSRSHLVFSVIIESTNLQTGVVLKGKLSLVDLAGSERVNKTGATAERLKEAQSINKSLSALGDVISALSQGESFVPYRNNKLTLLMSDSLGGNAKTLMFVNISPADYNADETVISLTYASRVKLITNDAQKNADNKEIARLKRIIEALKSGKSAEQAEQEANEAAG